MDGCKQTNYSRFDEDKGFNILGISLNMDKDDRKGAANADKFTWTHASDLQRFEVPAQH
jgi:hypothetical protein